jgi:GTP 3',8-cyclase
VELVRMLAGVPGIRDLAMTSNGLLLAQYAAQLRAAGLQRINISLDTLKPERFQQMTGSDSWRQVMDGIGAALAAGFEQVKLNVVAIRGYNDDEIADFISFVRGKPLHLRFIEFMPVGNNFWIPEKLITAAEIKRAVERTATLRRFVTSDRNTAVELYGIEGSPATVGFIPAMSDKFCQRCNRIRLTADGFLKPCLACKNEINIKVPVRQGHKGAELKRVFYEALRLKPHQHSMEGGKAETKRHMAEVGG